MTQTKGRNVVRATREGKEADRHGNNKSNVPQLTRLRAEYRDRFRRESQPRCRLPFDWLDPLSHNSCQ